MHIIIDRDAVCAADDMSHHREEFTATGATTNTGTTTGANTSTATGTSPINGI